MSRFLAIRTRPVVLQPLAICSGYVCLINKMPIPDSGLRYEVKRENDLLSFHCRVVRKQQRVLTLYRHRDFHIHIGTHTHTPSCVTHLVSKR